MGLLCCWSRELMYLATGLIGILVWHLIKQIKLLTTLPPGPWGLPRIGQLIYLNKTNALEEFQKWRKIYGDIFSYSIGDFYVAVFNDFKSIMDVLKQEDFQARPDFQSWTARNGVKNRGILFSDGVASWNEQRRFSLRTLRDFGFGKDSMEGLLQSEMETLVNKFKKEIAKGEAMDLSSSFSASVFNSLWYIVSGVRFDLDDPEFHSILIRLQGHLKQVQLTTPAAFFPWPAKVNLVRRGVWARMVNVYKDLDKIADDLLDNHLKTYDENQTRDFIDAFLHQTEEKKEEKSSSFNKDNFRETWQVLMKDLFSAGTETSSTTLLWAILYMCKFPDVQKKLQEEVDRVIGNKRLPSRADKQNMPYVEAFTNETHRKASLLPMSVYHATAKDTVYNGHFLPKGTVVFPNFHALHHEKSYWGDPEVFRPERFLDSTETKLVKHEYLIPFSAGKRQCLGETLARDTLFIFLTGLIQNFSFELDPSDKDIDPFQLKPLFVVSPDPYKVLMRKRVA